MSHVMATCDACGRYMSAARHPEPSGANPRRKRHPDEGPSSFPRTRESRVKQTSPLKRRERGNLYDNCAGPRLLVTGSPKKQSLCRFQRQRPKPKTSTTQRGQSPQSNAPQSNRAPFAKRKGARASEARPRGCPGGEGARRTPAAHHPKSLPSIHATHQTTKTHDSNHSPSWPS